MKPYWITCLVGGTEVARYGPYDTYWLAYTDACSLSTSYPQIHVGVKADPPDRPYQIVCPPSALHRLD